MPQPLRCETGRGGNESIESRTGRRGKAASRKERTAFTRQLCYRGIMVLSTTTRSGYIPAGYSAFVRRRGEQYLDSSAFKMLAFARQAHPLITDEYESQFWRVDRPCGFHSGCILLRGGRRRSLFADAGGATSQALLRGCSASAVVQVEAAHDFGGAGAIFLQIPRKKAPAFKKD